MTRDDIRGYAKAHRLAVLASTAADGSPQAAIIGVAVTDDLELIFDTLNTSRKYANLKARPARRARARRRRADAAVSGHRRGAFGGEALARCKPLYFAVWPDGPAREGLPGHHLFPRAPDLAALQRFQRRAAKDRGDDVGLGGSIFTPPLPAPPSNDARTSSTSACSRRRPGCPRSSSSCGCRGRTVRRTGRVSTLR